ncbi:sensor histidine kinase [Desertivirga xinjiangensis]|uniref:sensor histidine kinase n=1 Tax=Desertivirga xinjiangensis TaxID=539206 RepID=UPI00210E94E1|nr:histidine kinase [Pedobacter xinjiangensis]
MKESFLRHFGFWLLAILVLTWIYGTAFDNFALGFLVILMLIPVHMLYFYTVAYWVVPRILFRQKYLLTFFACLLSAVLAAVLYRLNEILVSDPYIYNVLSATEPNFTWSKLDGSFSEQFLNPHDFVNAVERSNVIVWAGVSLKFIKMWYERRQAAMQAELNFLKAQIHPHFLFNTLNNLYALSLNQSTQVPEIVMGLSNILRYILYEGNMEEVLLKRDIEILENYIALEKIRYEERLELNFNLIGSVDGQKIVPLLMLPLVENAFKHGVSETVEAPWINIELLIDGKDLSFKVSNSKPAGNSNAVNRDFEKVGLSNVKKRLELLYPGRYSLELLDEEEVYIAILKLELDKPAYIV